MKTLNFAEDEVRRVLNGLFLLEESSQYKYMLDKIEDIGIRVITTLPFEWGKMTIKSHINMNIITLNYYIDVNRIASGIPGSIEKVDGVGVITETLENALAWDDAWGKLIGTVLTVEKYDVNKWGIGVPNRPIGSGGSLIRLSLGRPVWRKILDRDILDIEENTNLIRTNRTEADLSFIV